MRIFVTRHGQTNLNKEKLMQGLINEPLNDTGRQQALIAREAIKDISFDAVYSSTLDRAIETASIMANVPVENVIKDPRIVEVNFGPYERRSYYHLGLKMTLFWICPEVFKEPKGMETIKEMADRVESFFKDLEKCGYENVLIACHGGIMRVICGYLEYKSNKIKWRPKPENCEIREYKYEDGRYTRVNEFNK